MTDSDHPKITVISVAWNSGDHLQRSLDALQAQTFSNFEVLIWDNASSDGSIERLRLPRDARIVTSTENLGFAVANNLAIKQAKTPLVALLNPDAFPEPNWLQSLLDVYDATAAAAVGSVQLSDANPTVLDGAGDAYSVFGVAWRGGEGRRSAWRPTAVVDVFSACACAALYERETFLAMGGFDESFFCYFEDVEFGFRLRLAGYCSVLAPGAIVRHVGSASAGRSSRVTRYYGTRNRIYTFVKCMPLVFWPVGLPALLLIDLLSIAMSVTPEERRGRWEGLVAGVGGCARQWRKRRPVTVGAFLGLMPAFSWNPFSLVTRPIVARQVRRR